MEYSVGGFCWSVMVISAKLRITKSTMKMTRKKTPKQYLTGN